MRLIDADELKKAIMLKEDVAYETWNELYDSVLEEIDNAPTVHDTINLYPSGEVIIQQTRPQGKWDEICEPFGWDDILSARCSVCGESYPYPEDTGFNDIVEMFKYCPNCGAKMEAGNRWKEEEDEE